MKYIMSLEIFMPQWSLAWFKIDLFDFRCFKVSDLLNIIQSRVNEVNGSAVLCSYALVHYLTIEANHHLYPFR